MNKGLLVGVSIGAFFLLMIAFFGISYVSLSNKEVRLRNQIEMKMQDNQSEYDNMWKKIKQVAQVTEKDRESLMEIFVAHADARTSDDGGALMQWVQESIPNVDNSLYKSLMNTITSSRDAWTMRQKELLNMKMQHDNILMTFPGSLFLGSRERIEVTIVTSSRTDKAFETGQDDDVDVFGD